MLNKQKAGQKINDYSNRTGGVFYRANFKTKTQQIMKYINYKYNEYHGIETIDSCETFKEAKYLLKEYQLADRSGNYWISQRSTN